MMTATSPDGMTIAYETIGSGPSVTLVDGALCTRRVGPGRRLARALSGRFAVTTYDRRGRGESGPDPGGYAPEREVEDLVAVLESAGGDTFLFGHSSGAVLALDAAVRLPQVTRLAVYEAPCIVDSSHPPTGPAYYDDLAASLERGDRGRAVRLFLALVGLPGVTVQAMRLTPLWPRLKAIAHTLPFDAEITRDYQQGTPLPLRRWSPLAQPTLVLSGARSDTWMVNGMEALAEVLPEASYRSLSGQTHNLRAKVVAPELTRFYDGATP